MLEFSWLIIYRKIESKIETHWRRGEWEGGMLRNNFGEICAPKDFENNSNKLRNWMDDRQQVFRKQNPWKKYLKFSITLLCRKYTKNIFPDCFQELLQKLFKTLKKFFKITNSKKFIFKNFFLFPPPALLPSLSHQYFTRIFPSIKVIRESLPI